MERGKLYYHDLEDEAILLEPYASLQGQLFFKLSFVGDEERIEIRQLSRQDLEALRLKIDEALREYPEQPAPEREGPEVIRKPDAPLQGRPDQTM
jgi:hypothetical protein